MTRSPAVDAAPRRRPAKRAYHHGDLRQALIDGGFDAENVFADYDPLGRGEYHIFGGVKA